MIDSFHTLSKLGHFGTDSDVHIKKKKKKANKHAT